MYHEHFGFHTDPFPLSPSLRFLFHSRPFEETMAHIVYGLRQGEDIILITGAIGTGKTMSLHHLLAQTESSYRQVFINVTQVNYTELLKLIVRDLGLDSSQTRDRADLLLALRDELRATARRGQKVLLVVDEAQNLDLDTLEGLRLLGNLAAPAEPVLRIVLSGQPSLERKLARPELAQLRQRIRVHYRLETLGRDEVEQYVQLRVRVAGGGPKLFSGGAIDRIHQLSGGVPRLINHLAAKGLLAAFVDGAGRVEAAHIDPADVPAPPPLTAEAVEVAAGRAEEAMAVAAPAAATRPAVPPRPTVASPAPPPATPPPAAAPAPRDVPPPAPAPRPAAPPPPASRPAVAPPAPATAPPAPAPTPPAPPVAPLHAEEGPDAMPEAIAAPRRAPAARAATASRERLDDLLPAVTWRQRSGRWTLLYVSILVIAAFILAVVFGPSVGDLTRELIAKGP